MASSGDDRDGSSDCASGNAVSPLPIDRHQTGLQLQDDQDQDDEQFDSHIDYRHVRNLLYISHFLSTWNSRLFEFGAFLFLANIYPNTLLPASVYALSRAASAAILSPVLGGYIDRVNRLSIVRMSIGKLSRSMSGKAKCSF